jgi:hypothetical protein
MKILTEEAYNAYIAELENERNLINTSASEQAIDQVIANIKIFWEDNAEETK